MNHCAEDVLFRQDVLRSKGYFSSENDWKQQAYNIIRCIQNNHTGVKNEAICSPHTKSVGHYFKLRIPWASVKAAGISGTYS